MCNNRQYSEAERREIDRMGIFAVGVLKGESLEDIASKNGTTVDDVKKTLENIYKINPPLHKQVEEKLNGH